eukprot:UN06860
MGTICNCSVPKQDELLAQAAAAQSNTISSRKTIKPENSSNIKPINTMKNILDNVTLREKSLHLCKEAEVLDVDGDDSGYITFLEKYLSFKTIDVIFTKSDMEYISTTKELTSILSITIAAYKAHCKIIKNLVFDGVNQGRTRFLKCDIKPIAKYLSTWIITKYYTDNGEIYITKTHFKQNMHKYLKEFIVTEWIELPYRSGGDILSEKSE